MTDFWNNEEFDKPIIQLIDKEYLDFEGTPIYVTISKKMWDNVQEFTFKNDDGKAFTNDYLETDKGWLRLGAKRLIQQLKPLRYKKGIIKIQRWCEGKDYRSTIYSVEFEPSIVKKKPPTKK